MPRIPEPHEPDATTFDPEELCVGQHGGHVTQGDGSIRQLVLAVPAAPDLRLCLLQALRGRPCLNGDDADPEIMGTYRSGLLIPRMHIGAIVLVAVHASRGTARIVGQADETGVLVEEDVGMRGLPMAEVHRLTGAWESFLTEQQVRRRGRPQQDQPAPLTTKERHLAERARRMRAAGEIWKRIQVSLGVKEATLRRWIRRLDSS